MALTIFNSSTNTAVQQEIYARRAFLWAVENMFFSSMVGKQLASVDGRTGKNVNAIEKSNGNNSIITLKDNLKKERGETINFHILAPLTGLGVTGDNQLTDNEENLAYHNMSVSIEQRRNAVKVAGMSRQRTFTDVIGDAKEALQLWIAEMIETDTLLSLCGLANGAGTLSAVAPSTNRVWYGGQTTGGTLESVAADVNIDSTTLNLFGTVVISAMKRKAQVRGTSYPKMRPILYKGKKYYVMLIHPLQAKSLKSEAAWINANKDGWHRGESNPLFSGALGIWDGVIIHEYDRIETRTGDANGAAATDPGAYFELADGCANTIQVARALFLGAQACVHAVAKSITMKTENKDYGNRVGWSVGMIWNPAKVQFNSVDYGVITVDTAVVAD